MTYRAKTGVCKWVAAGLYLISQLTVSAENTHGELPPTLNLFISTPEQLNLEEERRHVKADDDREDKSLITAGNEELESGKSVTDELDVEEQRFSPQRYDGVVFRGDQVLGVWFDGSRHAENPDKSGFQLEHIDRSGRIEFSTESDSYQLNPGEVVPQKPSADLASAVTTDTRDGGFSE